jgi:hypothetical protein
MGESDLRRLHTIVLCAQPSGRLQDREPRILKQRRECKWVRMKTRTGLLAVMQGYSGIDGIGESNQSNQWIKKAHTMWCIGITLAKQTFKKPPSVTVLY